MLSNVQLDSIKENIPIIKINIKITNPEVYKTQIDEQYKGYISKLQKAKTQNVI